MTRWHTRQQRKNLYISLLKSIQPRHSTHFFFCSWYCRRADVKAYPSAKKKLTYIRTNGMCICLGSIVMRSHPNNVMSIRWTVVNALLLRIWISMWIFVGFFSKISIYWIFLLIGAFYLGENILFCMANDLKCIWSIDFVCVNVIIYSGDINATICHKPFDRCSQCCMPIHCCMYGYPHQCVLHKYTVTRTHTRAWSVAHRWEIRHHNLKEVKKKQAVLYRTFLTRAIVNQNDKNGILILSIIWSIIHNKTSIKTR